MNKSYLIKFRPVETYFFGGETTFGDDRTTQNYFVKSNYYPQQTTLLGMLRFELLKFHELLPLSTHRTTAVQRIGKKSFGIDDSEFKFGDIMKISPLFMLYKGKEYYFGNDYAELELEEVDGKSFTDRQNESIPFLPKYNPKKEKYSDKLISAETNETHCFKDVFIEQTQVGIDVSERNKNEETNEDAFYRQTSFRLNDGWEFAFIAELGNETDFGISDASETYSSIAIMGGERSHFSMEMQKAEKSYFEIFNIKEKENSEKAVLMSDAKVSSDIYEHCKFAITQTQDFKYLTFNNSNFAMNPEKSAKYNLLKRGSVFFIKDKEKFETQFKNDNLNKIGLNTYKLI